MTTKKALVLADELAHDLSMRLGATLAATLALSSDSDGNPIVSFGSGVAGSANFVIRVKPETLPGGVDILGLTTIPYGPHIVQLGTEEDYHGTSDNIADSFTRQQLASVLFECMSKGCKFEWYESQYATAPTSACLTTTVSGTNLGLKAFVQPSLKYPLVQNS